ncbi:MAG: sugar transferase [Lachnospiraceae bacterium]
MQNDRTSYWVKHLDFYIIDTFSVIVSFYLAFSIYFGDWNFERNQTWDIFLVVIIFLNLIILFASCPYSGILRQRSYMIALKSGVQSIYLLLFACLVFYAVKIGSQYSRVTIFLTVGIYFLISAFLKCVWKKLLVQSIRANETATMKSMVVLSDQWMTKEDIADIMTGDIKRYDVRSVVLYGETAGVEQCSATDIVAGDEEMDVVTDGNEDVVFINSKDIRLVDYVLLNDIQSVYVSAKMVDSDDLKRLADNGIEIIYDLEKILGYVTDTQFIDTVGVHRIMNVGSYMLTERQNAYARIKRLIDIVCGLIGSILVLPVIVIVKLAYLLHGDTHPIIFVQDRVGKDGKLFKLYKFRTMVPNAGELLQELLKQPQYREEWEKNQKFENDPRIEGAIGRLLRRTSIDEMPQFFNVLKGDMSLVGPRPLVPGELERHNGLKLYHRVRPGVTGWWACNGRSNIGYRERLELEYHYVRNFGWGLDFMCLLRTVLLVMKREGAV